MGFFNPDLHSSFFNFRRANNHYKLVFQGDERYAFTLASTASEVRGMKNSYSDIAKMVSVYK